MFLAMFILVLPSVFNSGILYLLLEIYETKCNNGVHTNHRQNIVHTSRDAQTINRISPAMHYLRLISFLFWIRTPHKSYGGQGSHTYNSTCTTEHPIYLLYKSAKFQYFSLLIFATLPKSQIMEWNCRSLNTYRVQPKSYLWHQCALPTASRF